MSEPSNVITGIIEQKLLNLHTGYFAKVVRTSGNTATIQPLNMIKATGGTAKKQAVLTVPILRNACKFSTEEITVDGRLITVAKAEPIAAGDIVFCLCGERDITETKQGRFAIPPSGHHRISDSVIIGCI